MKYGVVIPILETFIAEVGEDAARQVARRTADRQALDNATRIQNLMKVRPDGLPAYIPDGITPYPAA